MKSLFYKKIFFIFIMTSFLFLSGNIVLAQGTDSILPENNPLCWKEEACVKKREALLGQDKGRAKDGWVKEAPCTGDWGKCLPVSMTKTQISIGNVGTFSNAGEYIKTIYNYSLSVIGILATVVLIISGAQWIGSGGNAEVISQAKKRVSGSVIGLFITYMSYVILSSVNPASVNMVQPNVWMVAGIEERNPEVKVGNYCDPTGGETKIACEASGENICFPIGYDENRQGVCAQVAFAISSASVAVVGGAVAGVGSGALSSGVSRVVTAGGSSIKSFVSGVPASELAKYTTNQLIKESLLGLGKKVFSLKGVVWGGAAVAGGALCSDLSQSSGDMISCGKIVATGVQGAAAGAQGVAEWSIDQFTDFFKNRNGVCLPKAQALPNGAMCDVNKSQCAEGKCVKMKGVTEVFKCWANTEIGFCSDGKNGSQCYSSADCLTGYNCVEDAYVPLCSDGRVGSPCGNNNDCVSKICNKDRCVGSVLADGSWCSDTAECSSNSQCIAIMNCGPNYTILTPGVCDTQCQAWDLSVGRLWEGKWGVCLPINQVGKIDLIKQKMQMTNNAPASQNQLCPGY